ncbi:MAG: PLP-dependent aminotransferase family protein [Gammaproteobacteria bacterium]|nr:PLP-dependent aminotransferase family protein [Gammaproteobacteria bacterium]
MDIRIDRNGDGPRRAVYLQIADQIRDAVARGELTAGARLPAIRGLAANLGVNRDTVSLAYELLVRDGLLEATVGRGTFVRQGRGYAGEVRRSPPFAQSVERLLHLEQARPSYSAVDGAVPLHALTPDPSLYPLESFRRSLDRVLENSGSELLVYGEHQGSLELRQAIARRLAAHRMTATADDIVLCQGASQGISLAMRLFAEPGDWVAVEEPTYHNVLTALVSLGLRAAPIPMTDDGPDLEVLGRTLARPEVKLFYTMPSFHNPLGTTTSEAHRRALVDLAARMGKPVIEDGFEMDLRYAGDPVTPLAALDPHGLVVHLFSFSKSLFPGVRIGAITARGRAVEGLLALKNAADLSGAMILQAAVADFINEGGYERHLTGLRGTLRKRRDAMVDALAAHMPDGARWTVPVGGYQLWLELPGELDTSSLFAEAKRAGVLFAPGHQFHHDGRPSQAMRLTTALADAGEIQRGIEILGRVVKSHLPHARRMARDRNIHV